MDLRCIRVAGGGMGSAPALARTCGRGVCFVYRVAVCCSFDVACLQREAIWRSVGFYPWPVFGKGDRRAHDGTGCATLSRLAQHAGSVVVFSQDRRNGNCAFALGQPAVMALCRRNRNCSLEMAWSGDCRRALIVDTFAVLCLFHCLWIGADFHSALVAAFLV